jgi:hypothetical protein
MGGGGFFCFVSYGSQNVLLSANPDITFFYKVFRKYTHFAEESFTIAVDGPNELVTFILYSQFPIFFLNILTQVYVVHNMNLRGQNILDVA